MGSQISPEIIIAAATIGGALATTIWYAAMHIGRMTLRIERVEKRVDDHDRIITNKFRDRRMGISDH